MNRPGASSTATALASAVVELVEVRRHGSPNELASTIVDVFGWMVGAGRVRIIVELDERRPSVAVEKVFDDRGDARAVTGGSSIDWIIDEITLSEAGGRIGLLQSDVMTPNSHDVESLLALSAHLLVDQWWAERLTGTVAQLERALRSRLRIEQAKGVMSERLGVTPDEAFAQLRASARSEHRSIDDVAGDVLAAVSQRRC
jgi:hypothetical protein